MIQIEHVFKKFGDKEVIHDLSLHVPKGELFAYLGPNGAGKTTTIKMLTGLLKPTTGRVLVKGHDVEKEPLPAKKVISYVPDLPYLYEKLTAEEFLRFIGNLYGANGKVLEEKIGHFLTMFDLEEFSSFLIEDLSHGMRQRLVFGAALLHDPEVMIIDEPMVGLDPRSARLVKDVLRERADNGTTVFMSTHSLSVAEELADRIGILNHGRLVIVGTFHELKETSGRGGRLEDIFLQLTAEKPEPDVGARQVE
ncbi:ABC transporter ATP-binding protein [bacterium]|nr:ABC transporter ATP-binding protein [bacterium]